MGRRSWRNQVEKILAGDPATLLAHWRTKFAERIADRTERVVLCGAGYLGKWVLNRLRGAGCEPLAFCDNSPRLWGQVVHGVGVLSPEQAISLHGGAALFVVTVYTCAPLLVQMRDLGARVITFPEFAWANPEWLLPHAALDLPQSIFDDAEAVREAAEIWHDEASFQEYVGQLHWRTSLDEATLPSHLAPNETYFPLDLLTRSDDEVFVDCGAFDGDSIRTFIERWGGSFGRAIGIEADPVNCRRMQDYFASVPAPLRSRLTALNLAVGAAEGLVRFNTTGTAGSSIGAGEMEVRCEPLDKALGSEIPTFIKMDIEGAETEALLGARETLKRHAPVLAVCLYHRPSDLWRIPLLIRSIQPSYRLFLRRYADDCWEEVCYAIPESRLK